MVDLEDMNMWVVKQLMAAGDWSTNTIFEVNEQAPNLCHPRKIHRSAGYMPASLRSL
jgi:hypothetical protein